MRAFYYIPDIFLGQLIININAENTSVVNQVWGRSDANNFTEGNRISYFVYCTEIDQSVP